MKEKLGYSFKAKDKLGSLCESPAFCDASAMDLRVLVTLVISDCDITRKELMRRSACDAETLTGALQYWRGAGVLVKDSGEKKTAAAPEKKEQENKKKPVASPDKFGESTADELARQIDRDKLKSLIEACQQITGKTLSTAEINIIVGMHRELSLDGDYIITLVSYCYENDRRSLKYAEKMAFVLTGEGIMTEPDLVAYIDERKRFATLEWQLKKKFGMGNRDFTQKQASYVHKWEKDYSYGLDVITLAFDITVESINKAEFKYMDAILTKWHTAGCKTEAEVLEFIKQDEAQRKSNATHTGTAQGTGVKNAKPKNSTVGDSSFDTDDFFNHALARSYKD